MARKYPKPPSGGLSGSTDFDYIENSRARLGYSPQWDEEHQPDEPIQEWRLNARNDGWGGA